MGLSAGRSAEDVERAGKKMEASGGRLSSMFSNLARTGESWGLPFTNSLSKTAEKLKATDGTAAGFFNKVSAVGGIATAAGAAGLIAFGAEAVHLGDQFASANAQVASAAGVSTQAATQIDNSFKKIHGMESAEALAQAYAGVAGIFTELQGHALNAAQADTVMAASADLADAKLGGLTATTKTLGTVMQAYHVPISQAAATSDVLFNVSTKTGVGLAQVGTVLQRMKGQLGVLAPSLQDTATFMLDLTQHGETGRVAIGALNAAFTTLLQTPPPTAPAALAKEAAANQAKLAAANAAVTKSEIALQSTKDRLATSTQSQTVQADTLAKAELAVQDAETKRNQVQQAVADSQAASTTGMTKARTEAKQLGINLFTVNGHFVGMQSVIAQLQPKLEKMTQEQQLQATNALFGASAGRKLLDTILAGPQAYAKDQAAVEQANTAHAAAERQMHTLGGEAHTLGAELTNVGISAGEWLIPKMEQAAQATAEVIAWFQKHEAEAKILAGVIAGVLGGAMTVYAVNKVSQMANSSAQAIKAIGNLGGKAVDVGKKILGLGGAVETEAGEATASAPENDALAASKATLGDAAATAEGEVGALGATTALEGGTAATGLGAAVVPAGVTAIGALTAWGIASGIDPNLIGTGYAKSDSFGLPQKGGFKNLTNLQGVTGGLTLPPSEIVALLNMLHQGVPGAGLAAAPGTRGRASGRAFGGPVVGGIPYDVGEDEIFVSGSSGLVTPLGNQAQTALSGQYAGSMTTVYHIGTLQIVAQNPAQFQEQLQQRARVGALSGNPTYGPNIGVAS